jgi:hypothetical protein
MISPKLYLAFMLIMWIGMMFMTGLVAEFALTNIPIADGFIYSTLVMTPGFLGYLWISKKYKSDLA